MKLTPISTLFTESYVSYCALVWRLVQIEMVPLAAMLVGVTLAGVSAFLVGPGTAIALIIIAMIIALTLGVSSSIAMIRTVAAPDTHFSLRASFEATRAHFLPYLFVSIIGTLLTILGFLLFIIPGVFIAVWFVFAYFECVLAGKRGVDALMSSKELVRGLWVPIFVRLLLLGLGIALCSVVVGGVSLWAFGDGALASIINNAFSIVISPFVVVYTYNLYHDVRRAHHHRRPEAVPVLA